MTPRHYEEQVARHFMDRGYDVILTPQTNDYGVDIFASKGKVKIAIQSKMYGSANRSVNRKMIMELCGAMHYFGCTSATMVTDGEVLSDAKKVADKLNIEIIYLKPDLSFKLRQSKTDTFSEIWKKYILTLEGKVLTREDGKKNKIIAVDWSGVKRISSNGKVSSIKIEIFKEVINYLDKKKEITRKHINDEYDGRASSGVCLILSQVPFIQYERNPTRLIWKK